MEEIDENKLKRLRNLRMFKDKTDEEIIAYLQNREPKKIKTQEEVEEDLDDDAQYEKKFKQRFNKLRDDYSVDINDSNDVETLRTLVRVVLQLEELDKSFRRQQKLNDSRELKNLSDVQRSLVQSANDLQDKLGISRRMRKEKTVDDIPQYIAMLKEKARKVWDRETVSVRCEKCQIELARYWLNFPNKTKHLGFEGECWKCGEKVIYNRE